ncbi:MAG: prepilin-type N-terminal cleavage/methylation domain-containing protein [Synergistaceae bacterium]|jgi:general secretion pathway protein G|nr:prepilin-type N-terminal cleavage/methylation domain-containing protein [Synergistaceae bacterium]
MKARKGFTLVELLIVIVIIGILASSMLLSSSSATASAEASNIVSELRSLKAATMMFYSDSMDTVNSGGANTVINDPGSAKALLGKYMDNPEKLSGLYLFKSTEIAGVGRKWFVGYNLSSVTGEVREKLAGKAKSTGLYSGAGSTQEPSSIAAANIFTSAGVSVWVIAR